MPAARSEELGGDVVDTDAVGEVAGGQPDQQPAVGDAQRVDRLLIGQGRDRGGVGRLGADRTQQVGAHREGRRPGGAEHRVSQVAPVLRVPAQVVAERGAGAEHGQQPHRGALVVGEPVEHPVRLLDPLGQVRQRLQRQVRVGGRRHEVQQLGAGVPEAVQRVGGAVGFLEAQPDQPAGGGADPAVDHRAATASWASAAKPVASPRQVRRISSPASATSRT